MEFIEVFTSMLVNRVFRVWRTVVARTVVMLKVPEIATSSRASGRQVGQIGEVVRNGRVRFRYRVVDGLGMFIRSAC